MPEKVKSNKRIWLILIIIAAAIIIPLIIYFSSLSSPIIILGGSGSQTTNPLSINSVVCARDTDPDSYNTTVVITLENSGSSIIEMQEAMLTVKSPSGTTIKANQNLPGDLIPGSQAIINYELTFSLAEHTNYEITIELGDLSAVSSCRIE